MDIFKKRLTEQCRGPGGLGCRCCNMSRGSRKPSMVRYRTNMARTARSRIKANDAREAARDENEIGNPG